MKKTLYTLAGIIAITAASAQVKWPVVTQTAKPWTRWWWEGSAVNKADLTRNMERYAKAGLGGLEITPIYGVMGTEDQFIDFLSPKWVEMLQHTLATGKKLGLGIDMATGTGWPFGGPWVNEADACKYVTYKTFTLNGGETLAEPVEFEPEAFVRTANGKPVKVEQLSRPVNTNKNLQALALDQVRYPGKLPLVLVMAYDENGNSVDITKNVAQGKLNWTAPAGKWTLYALFQGLHGKMVERAAPGGEGNVIDHFNKPALDKYLGHFDQSFAGKDISGLRSFFNDSYEVDDARGQSNWTPDFFEQFKARRGYDLRTQLPALYQKNFDDKKSRVLWDYRETISDLLLEKFTEPWHAWAKKQGKLIRNQSHGSPANTLDLYAAIDIPETEGTDILRFKFATSAAHVTGKPLASSETATWLNEHFQSSLGDVKLIMDKYFVGGVNHVFYHGTNYSPQNATWPGWLFYAAVHFHPNNPFWKDFGTLNNYAARVQSFMQAGKPSGDILFYFPFNDRNSEQGRDMLHHYDGMEGFEKTTFKKSGEALLEDGYAFDFISDRQIMQLQSDGAVIKTGGIKYQTVLLSGVKLLPVETLDKLIKLAEKGATIIIHDNMPQDVPGFGKLEERRAAYKQLLGKIDFKNTASPVVKEAKVGAGRFLLGDELNVLMAYGNVRREVLTMDGMKFIRRTIAGGEYYFISNEGKKTIDGYVNLNCDMNGAVLYDPMLERSGVAQTRTGDNETLDVYLQLQPGESCIVQTSKNKPAGKLFPYVVKTGDAIVLKADWDLKFTSGGPVLPAPVKLTKLKSWTDLDGDDGKNFSGTAQYSTSFAKPAGNAAGYLLNLGEVSESAELTLNGRKIATLLGPVYTVVIPAAAVKPGNNLLQINVTNGMANRIADLDRRGVQWKKFYNINFSPRLAENRGADGVFTAAKWKPKAAGLLSEVSITPVSIGTLPKE